VRKCERGEVKLGKPYLYKRVTPIWILNFPTKDHWRSVARLDDIIRGLEYLEQHYREWAITSMAVPPHHHGNWVRHVAADAPCDLAVRDGPVRQSISNRPHGRRCRSHTLAKRRTPEAQASNFGGDTLGCFALAMAILRAVCIRRMIVMQVFRCVLGPLSFYGRF
jgi:hypothetical protein